MIYKTTPPAPFRKGGIFSLTPQGEGVEGKLVGSENTLRVSGEAAGKGDPAGRPYGVGSLAPETQNLKPRTQNPHLAGGEARPTMAGGAQARRLCHQKSPLTPLYKGGNFTPTPALPLKGEGFRKRAGTPAPLVFPLIPDP